MVDIIMEKDADLAQKILSGKLRVSHDNIIELSRLPQENIKRLNKTLSKEGLIILSSPISSVDFNGSGLWNLVPRPSLKRRFR